MRNSLWFKKLLEIDKSASERMRAVPKGKVSRALIGSFSHTGDTVVWLTILLILHFLGREDIRKPALVWLAVLAACLGITEIFKYLFRRKRPEGDWGGFYRKTDPHSFPSAHASRAGTLIVLSIAYLPPSYSIPLCVWAALLPFSRVMMGVHYLLDIVVGFGLGLVIGAAALFVLPLVL